MLKYKISVFIGKMIDLRNDDEKKRTLINKGDHFHLFKKLYALNKKQNVSVKKMKTNLNSLFFLLELLKLYNKSKVDLNFLKIKN